MRAGGLILLLAALGTGCALTRAAGEEDDDGSGGGTGGGGGGGDGDGGDGSGAFELVTEIESLGAPTALAVRNLAGDELPDLAVLDSEQSKLHLYVNQGDGGVADRVVAADGNRFLFAGTYLSSGDEGQPGRDLVYVNSDLHLVVVDGDGLGGLVAEDAGLAVAPVVMTYVADIGGGGGEGLALIDTAGAFMLLAATGDGDFGAAPGPNPPSLGTPIALAAVDLDGSGTIDFLLAQLEFVFVSFTGGDGTHGPWLSLLDADAEVRHFAVGNLDERAGLDVVVATADSAQPLHLYRRDDEGDYVEAPIAGTSAATEVAVADVDGDGLDDIVAFDRTGAGAAVSVLVRNGVDASFAPAIAIDSVPPGVTAIADLDADGADDIALAPGSVGDGPLQIWRSRLAD